jgi:uncharacterized protein YdhG (YjbR/CyaY superfamily)
MPSVKSHFEKSSPDVRAAYDAVLQAARALGPVQEDPKQTSIHLVRRTAFAGVAVRRDALILTLKSTRKLDSPRVHKAEQASANRWHLLVRVEKPADVDGDLRSWLAASYELAGVAREKVMSRRAGTIDGFLATLDRDKRVALEKLRQAIHAAAPGAEECISYSLPAFRLDGKVIAWFNAAKGHCSFYPGSYPIRALADELKAYETSKGTIRFSAGRPLPASLVRKLVKASIEDKITRHATQRKKAKSAGAGRKTRRPATAKNASRRDSARPRVAKRKA